MNDIGKVALLTILFFSFIGPITIGILEGALAIGLVGVLGLVFELLKALVGIAGILTICVAPFVIAYYIFKFGSMAIGWLFEQFVYYIFKLFRWIFRGA